MKKDETLSVFVGDEKIGDVKTHTLNLPDTIPSNRTMMQFYYRRGNKYFFRSKVEKLMVETTAIKEKLKRGYCYLVSYE